MIDSSSEGSTRTMIGGSNDMVVAYLCGASKREQRTCRERDAAPRPFASPLLELILCEEFSQCLKPLTVPAKGSLR
jgi:hypothetical protein